MPRYKMIAMSQPVKGREDEYNQWYQNTHLKQVAALPGVVRAQRFRLAQSLTPGQTFPYMAIYDIDVDNIQTLLGEFQKVAGTDRLIMSEALDPENGVTAFYEELGDAIDSRKT